MLHNVNNILIVEDNPELQNLYETAFEIEGFHVIIADNGLDGAVKSVESHPDMILIDIMMPQMDGFELLSAMKNNSSLDALLVVNTNLDGAGDVKEKSMEAGADYFFQKSDHTPFELVNIVKSYCETGAWK